MSCNFTREDPGQLVGGSRFKAVEQFILPKVNKPLQLLAYHYGCFYLQLFSASVMQDLETASFSKTDVEDEDYKCVITTSRTVHMVYL